jgi:uncharacterized membrane protein YdcZ (DUF606 family)
MKTLRNMFKDTISKIFKVDNLISNLTGYVETKVELLKIEVKEELARSLAKAVAYIFIAFIFAVFVIFLSIAAALQLATSLGNVVGFSIVAGVYLVAGLITWFSRVGLISRLEKQFELMFRKKK